MRAKGIVEEDFVNYKVPSMFINTCFCDFKCCEELGLDRGVCQNAPLVQAPIREISDKAILRHFAGNPITKAVVIGGMEPMLQISELTALISLFRRSGQDAPFVIYTGYCPEEIPEQLEKLRHYPNIIVKFGRFVPGQQPHYDELLGVSLASDNQYARKIS